MPSVTRKPQANRQERREKMERRLLDATGRLMGDGASFTELSVDRLATEAGISRASFYVYFEDKGHLLRRLAVEVFDDLAVAARRWWSVAHPTSRDVHNAMTGVIAAYRVHQSVLVALNEMSPYDPQVGQVYRDLMAGMAGQLVTTITAGQAAGLIRADLPAAPIADALSWMVERTLQQNLPNKPPDYDSELADAITEIVWGALYLKPTTAG
jgi:AcrR family transcriptional regulator